MEVTILGCSSATGFIYRNQTAQILKAGKSCFLIDCGEGTQLQMQKFNIKPSKISAVFISHLHGDHYFGLIPLLSTMHLNGRHEPLAIYGPEGLEEILELQFHYSRTVLNFPVSYTVTSLVGLSLLMQNNDVKVESFPLTHRIPTTGFKFTSAPSRRHLRKDLLEHLPLPARAVLAGGNNYTHAGITYTVQQYTTGDTRPAVYAYCSDTLADGTYLPYITDATTLYHETTFLAELGSRALETYHSTTLQAAQVAKTINARALVIGHYSSRYRTTEALLAETRSIFPSTEAAFDGYVFNV